MRAELGPELLVPLERAREPLVPVGRGRRPENPPPCPNRVRARRNIVLEVMTNGGKPQRSEMYLARTYCAVFSGLDAESVPLKEAWIGER